MSKQDNSKQVKKFTSFEELGKSFGIKPRIYQTKNKQKLKQQREAFGQKHLCAACGKPMTFIMGTNIMVCQNPDCKGIKREYKNKKTGETSVVYRVPSHQLDERGTEIATNIFTELS